MIMSSRILFPVCTSDHRDSQIRHIEVPKASGELKIQIICHLQRYPHPSWLGRGTPFLCSQRHIFDYIFQMPRIIGVEESSLRVREFTDVYSFGEEFLTCLLIIDSSDDPESG